MPLKNCIICNKEFFPGLPHQTICSIACRKLANNQRSRLAMRKKRLARNQHSKQISHEPCQVCGYTEITVPYFEAGKQYQLCPNHCALRIYGLLSLPA